MVKRFWIALGMLLFASNVHAETVLNLSLNEQALYQPSREYLQLAANDMTSPAASSATVEEEPFRESWFTANKFHQYLGIGSFVLGSVAALLPKPDEDEDDESSAHHQTAIAAAVLGGTAVATGLVFHYKDLNFRKFYKDPDSLHAILATLGTVGFFAALSTAPDDTHATAGIAGLASMAVAIKITW